MNLWVQISLDWQSVDIPSHFALLRRHSLPQQTRRHSPFPCRIPHVIGADRDEMRTPSRPRLYAPNRRFLGRARHDGSGIGPSAAGVLFRRFAAASAGQRSQWIAATAATAGAEPGTTATTGFAIGTTAIRCPGAAPAAASWRGIGSRSGAGRPAGTHCASTRCPRAAAASGSTTTRRPTAAGRSIATAGGRPAAA